MPEVKVVCPRCRGKGTVPEYVGCNCVRDNPYDKVKCPECQGKRWIMAIVWNE